MKHFLLILSLTVFTITSFTQDAEWKLYSSVDGVEVYTKEIDCDAKNIPAQKAIIIKVVNTTANRVKVEWDKTIWYNDKKVINSSEEENHDVITLGEGTSKEGSCDEPRGALYIYKDFITYDTDTKLSKFELNNIRVVKL